MKKRSKGLSTLGKTYTVESIQQEIEGLVEVPPKEMTLMLYKSVYVLCE